MNSSKTFFHLFICLMIHKTLWFSWAETVTRLQYIYILYIYIYIYIYMCVCVCVCVCACTCVYVCHYVLVST